MNGQSVDSANTLRFDGLTLDLRRRTMIVDGQPIEPPGKEFELLCFLAARPGQMFTRAELLQHVWNSQPEWQHLSTVTEHIGRLRAKIDVNPSRPKFLHTVRGKGYLFEGTEQSAPTEAPTAGAESLVGTWVQIDARLVAADDGLVALLAAGCIADLIGREVDHFVAPSSQSALLAGREMRAAGYAPGPQLMTLRALDGTDRPCLISTDITQFAGGLAILGTARQIIDAPRLTREMVSGVVASVSDAVIVTDNELRVLSWSPNASQLYGWSEEQVLGHRLHTAIGDGADFRDGAQWDELQRNERWSGVLHRRTRTGKKITVATSVNLIREDGINIGIAIVSRPRPIEAPTEATPTDVYESTMAHGRSENRNGRN